MSESSTEAVFDADAKALEPPDIRIGRRRYRGRILSIVEWTPFLERFLKTTEQEFLDLRDAGAVASATNLASHAFCVEFLRAVLPKRWGRPDPVAQLEAQGSRLVKEAFAHFFGHQCYAHGVALRTPTDPATSPSPAPGNTSSGKTAAAAGADASS